MSAALAEAPPRIRRALEAARSALAEGRVAVLIAHASPRLERARAQCRALCEDLLRHADAGLFHSRSATPGLVAVAACAARPVGIDIQEVVADVVDDELARMALQPHEHALLSHDPARSFLRLWTRKEAALKALGTGLSIPPRSFCAGLGPGWQRIMLCGRAVYVCELEQSASFSVSLASLEAAPRSRSWHLDLRD